MNIIRTDIRNLAIIAHVDHGKTTLVDALLEQSGTFGEREVAPERAMDSNDLERERGITILAKNTSVKWKSYTINIVDTPGHAAFTAMRARGANLTDIAVIVIAADDGIMPQTEEAIRHAQDAGVPIIVACNKIDRPDSDADRVRNELSQHEVIPEEWGGENIFVHVSAKTGEGMQPWLDWLRGRYPQGGLLPDHWLLVGAGHATQLPMLAARRARGPHGLRPHLRQPRPAPGRGAAARRGRGGRLDPLRRSRGNRRCGGVGQHRPG